jgi:hypothetical protein
MIRRIPLTPLILAVLLAGGIVWMRMHRDMLNLDARVAAMTAAVVAYGSCGPPLGDRAT